MNSIWEFLSLVIFLHEIRRGFSNPTLCKRGKFYEANVLDYLDCSVCVQQPHFDNCKTCCGSVTSTTGSAFTLPTSASVKSESTKPEPAFHSYCDAKFFFQGTPLLAIILAFITGIIVTLVSILGVKLVNLHRRKVASAQRKPPIEETQADTNSSPFVELTVTQRNHETNSE